MVVGDEQASGYLVWNLPIRMACRVPVDLVPQRLALGPVFCFHDHLPWAGLAKLALRRASRAYLETKGYCAASSRLSVASPKI
jgi:hypothetical protein